jgi:hypothetical protein
MCISLSHSSWLGPRVPTCALWTGDDVFTLATSQDMGGDDDVIGAYPGGDDAYAGYYHQQQQQPQYSQPAAYEIQAVWPWGIHATGELSVMRRDLAFGILFPLQAPCERVLHAC